MGQDEGIAMAVGREVNEGQGGALLLQHQLPRHLPLKADVAVLDRPSQAEPRVGPRAAQPAQPPGSPPGKEWLGRVVEAQGCTEPPVLGPELTLAQDERKEPRDVAG